MLSSARFANADGWDASWQPLSAVLPCRPRAASYPGFADRWFRSANEFYPHTKAEHFPDEDWDFRAGGGPWHTPDHLKEGYNPRNAPEGGAGAGTGANEGVRTGPPSPRK